MAGLAAAADGEKDPVKAGILRRSTVYGSAALDNLGPVVDGLADSHAEVRDAAVQALRAWIGRRPGQDRKLYDNLQTQKKFSKGQAAIALDLLHTFGDDDLARPETYEALIAYLRHARPAVRGWPPGSCTAWCRPARTSPMIRPGRTSSASGRTRRGRR